MATEYASDDLARSKAPVGAPVGPPVGQARKIRLSKPEEGEAQGEVFHLIRALLIVIGGTALIAWMVS